MDVRLAGEAELNAPISGTGTLATDGEFLAWAGESSYVELLHLGSSAQPLRLSCRSQQRDIQALCLGRAGVGSSDPAPATGQPPYGTVLVSASYDAVVLWRLGDVYAAAASSHPLPEPLLITEGCGSVQAMCLGTTANLLTVCMGNLVDVYELNTLSHAYRLEGHAAPVLCATFCEPHAPHWLVTAGEDRTFMVWDLTAGSLVYRSPVLTAHPLTSLAVDPSYLRVAVGAVDGCVRVYDLASLPACRLLQVVDVTKQLQGIAAAAAAETGAEGAAGVAGSAGVPGRQSGAGQGRARPGEGPRVITARPTPGAPPQAGRVVPAPRLGAPSPAQEVSVPQVVLLSASILQLYYSPLRSPGADGLLGESPKLLVGTMGALAVVDAHTYEVVQAHFLPASGVAVPAAPTRHPPGSSAAHTRQQALTIPEINAAACYAFGLAPHEQFMYCAVAAEQEAHAAILTLCPLPDVAAAVADSAEQQRQLLAGPADGLVAQPGEAQPPPLLSVFQTQPLPDSSPLMVVWPAPTTAPSTPPRPSGSGLSRQQSAPTRPHGPSPQRAQAPVIGSPARQPSPGRSKWSAAPGPGGAAPVPCAPPARQPSPSRSKQPPGPHLPRSASSSSSSSTKTPLADKPVVFHRKIKSSGYGMVQPAIKLGRPPPPPVKVSTRPSTVSTVAKHLLHARRQYPVDCDPPTQLQERNMLPGRAPAHQGAILRLKFSGDASRLLTCSTDKSARVMKLPLSRTQGEGTDLLGHNGAVNSIDWSYDGVMALTASSDRSARLWNAGCAQPLLEFTHVQQQVSRPGGRPSASGAGSIGGSSASLTCSSASTTASSNASAGPSNPAFLHEVNAARFFYLDQFILLAAGNRLHLYRFKLNEGDADEDLARLRNNNKYRLAAVHASGAQAINDFSVANCFLSPLAFLAGSNRSIEVVDCTTMQCVTVVEEAHARPVHTIVQSAGSTLFASHPKEACELLLTSACDGVVRLWDVRAMSRCVRAFSGHKNSQMTVGATFSPCLRYICSGSEDQAAYGWDLRQGSLAFKLRGAHGDAVTDVAFNPLHAQLGVATLDGHVIMYGSGP